MNQNDYFNMLNKSVNVFTVNLPPEKKTEVFLTREQARAKELKEKEEVRLWWDNLPEEKRQEVRDQQFHDKKKKPEDKKPAKPKTPPPAEKEKEKYDRMAYERLIIDRQVWRNRT